MRMYKYAASKQVQKKKRFKSMYLVFRSGGGDDVPANSRTSFGLYFYNRPQLC